MTAAVLPQALAACPAGWFTADVDITLQSVLVVIVIVAVAIAGFAYADRAGRRDRD